MTLQELKYRVLLKLGVVAAGNPVNPDDGATVLLRYQALLALLTIEDLADWAVTDDVPDEFETPLVAMVAADCARDFGQTDQAIIAEGKFGLPQPSLAERQMRRIMARVYVNKPVTAEYF